jgi:hypothetical protein
MLMTTTTKRIGALALALSLLPVVAPAAEQPGARFREGTHYVLTGEEADRTDGINVTVFSTFVSETGADLERRLPAWIKGLPEGVNAFSHAPLLDEASDALSLMFYALEHLGRSDLHAQVFDWAFEQRRPLVAMAGGRVDLAQTVTLQSQFAQSFGITDDAFRSALAHDDVDLNQVAGSIVFSDARPLVQTLPAVVVNGKYLTDARRAGTDLLAVVEQLIAMADIDNALALGEESGRLANLDRDPVQAVWHTRIPGIFELQRSSGTWYLDRTGRWGGRASLTHLGSVTNVSANGAVRVGVNEALSAMGAQPRWVDATDLARLLNVELPQLYRIEDVGLWEVSRENGPYYLSSDALFHFYASANQTADSSVNDSAREVAASMRRDTGADSAPVRPTQPQAPTPAAPGPSRAPAASPPLREGLQSAIRPPGPSTAAEMAARRPLLAAISDDDVVTFAPAAPPATTLTAFVFADCAYCQALYSRRDDLVAMGVKIRFVPVAPSAVAEGVACASDRRAALTAVMTSGALPPKCSSAGTVDYRRLATTLSVMNAPTIFSATGTVVVGFTTPEELVRVLNQGR